MLESLHGPRAGHRDHPAAGPPLRRRRRHLLLRHRAAAQGGRRRPRHQAGRRPGRRRSRCAPSTTSRRSPTSTPEHVPFITEAVRALVGELGGTPLIGFAGAPFTVASYLVEGGPSKDHAKTKAMMFGAPDVWDALMRKIAGISAAYLEVQVAAGASAVQLFDSWAGALTPGRLRDARDAALRGRARARSAPSASRGSTSASAPPNLLTLMGEAGADVVGVDWRTPLADGDPAWSATAPSRATSTRPWSSRPTEVMTAARRRDHRGRPRRQGPRLQPRPRRHPVDRPRPARPADRVRPVLPARG